MALNFNANNVYVIHGNNSTINSLDAQTWMFWFYPTTFQANALNFTRRMLWKGSPLDISLGSGATSGSPNRVRYARTRATTTTDVSSDIFSTNAWQFLAVTDQDNVQPKMYRGLLNTEVAEVSSYNVQTTGVGAPTSDAANNLFVGARDASSRHSAAYIAHVWCYNRVLSLGEIRQHQFKPGQALSGLIFKTNYWSTAHIKDLSVNTNDGTLSGTPALVANPPLSLPYEI